MAGCSSGGTPQPSGNATPAAGGNLTAAGLYDYGKLHWFTMRQVIRQGTFTSSITDYRYELSRDTYQGKDVMHVRKNVSKNGILDTTDDYYDLATGDRLFERLTHLEPGKAPRTRNDTTVIKSIGNGTGYLTFNNMMLIYLSMPPVGQETLYINGEIYDCIKYMTVAVNNREDYPVYYAIWISPQVPAPVKAEEVYGNEVRTDELTGWG